MRVLTLSLSILLVTVVFGENVDQEVNHVKNILEQDIYRQKRGAKEDEKEVDYKNGKFGYDIYKQGPNTYAGFQHEHNLFTEGDKKFDVRTHWNKVINGPDRAKPNWGIGGTYRWRREANNGEEKEKIDYKNGKFGYDIYKQGPNTYAGFQHEHNLFNEGDKKFDVRTHWNKVINGPDRAKPNWGIGGTYRWRREANNGEEKEKIDYKNGKFGYDIYKQGPNTYAGFQHEHNLFNEGDKKFDVRTHWNKVINGPDRAKPNWGIGGTYRWRREANNQEEKEKIDYKNGKFGYDIYKQGPNTYAGFQHEHNLFNEGDKKFDVRTHWNKVINGPDRAKPNWGIGGTYRWRREANNDED